jgi:hypothetical protein
LWGRPRHRRVATQLVPRRPARRVGRRGPRLPGGPRACEPPLLLRRGGRARRPGGPRACFAARCGRCRSRGGRRRSRSGHPPAHVAAGRGASGVPARDAGGVCRPSTGLEGAPPRWCEVRGPGEHLAQLDGGALVRGTPPSARAPMFFAPSCCFPCPGFQDPSRHPSHPAADSPCGPRPRAWLCFILAPPGSWVPPPPLSPLGPSLPLPPDRCATHHPGDPMILGASLSEAALCASLAV